MVNSIYFYLFLLFYFIFIVFSYFELRVKVSVTLHMIWYNTFVTCYRSWSHNHISQKYIKCYGMLWILTFFFSFYLFFLILYFFSFEFLFPFYWWWRGTWHHSHMTGHMMWCHRPKIWWKDLKDDVRAYVYNMVALSRKWDGHEIVA